jgi:hypothetical protein
MSTMNVVGAVLMGTLVTFILTAGLMIEERVGTFAIVTFMAIAVALTAMILS